MPASILIREELEGYLKAENTFTVQVKGAVGDDERGMDLTLVMPNLEQLSELVNEEDRNLVDAILNLMGLNTLDLTQLFVDGGVIHGTCMASMSCTDEELAQFPMIQVRSIHLALSYLFYLFAIVSPGGRFLLFAH